MVTISFHKLRSSALASLSNLSKWMLSKISTWFWRRDVLLRIGLSLGFGAIWNDKVFYSSIDLYNETNITLQHLACHQFKNICVKLYTNMSFEHQPQRGTISILSTAAKEIKKGFLRKMPRANISTVFFPWHCRAFNKGYHVTSFTVQAIRHVIHSLVMERLRCQLLKIRRVIVWWQPVKVETPDWYKWYS